ncbi:MAG TPA: hypothetical protein ENO00_07200 [Deltaproteobacteria bacterium]|nr:hypothetical protein [Deltaproteobacteria bacterium]
MKEKIKMPISFHGNYVVSVTEGDEKKQGRCQKLFIKALPGDKTVESVGTEGIQKYRITYFDFGCRYLLNGILVENEEDHVSFESAGRIYRFSSVPVSKD